MWVIYVIWGKGVHRYKHFTEEAVYRMGQIKSRPQGERQTGLKKTDCRYVKKKRRRKNAVWMSVLFILWC